MLMSAGCFLARCRTVYTTETVQKREVLQGRRIEREQAGLEVALKTGQQRVL